MKRRLLSFIVVFLLLMSCSFVFATSTKTDPETASEPYQTVINRINKEFNAQIRVDEGQLQTVRDNITEYPVTVYSENLEVLNFVLPEKLSIDKSKKVQYYFIDGTVEECGFVSSIDYMDNFDFLTQMPNHSSVTNDEYIDIPLGKCRLITLDADNGTAASGITGTHDVYYASVPIKGTAIYVLTFTMNDKKPETKNQFMEMLNKLSLKY